MYMNSFFLLFANNNFVFSNCVFCFVPFFMFQSIYYTYVVKAFYPGNYFVYIKAKMQLNNDAVTGGAT